MTLNIRDPRAQELARELADLRHSTMTDVVIQSLEHEIKREKEKLPLLTRIEKIADDLQKMAKPGGHMMTKEEIDRMWGHE